MDVREKLWRFVKEAIHSWESDLNMSDHITDNLIAHGVTVQDNTEITDELLKQLRTAPLTVLHEEPTIEVVREWISVKDRLPDDNERVIAYRPNEPETSAYKYCVMWGWSVKTSLKHRGITHWRAMPQPPKGE